MFTRSRITQDFPKDGKNPQPLEDCPDIPVEIAEW